MPCGWLCNSGPTWPYNERDNPPLSPPQGKEENNLVSKSHPHLAPAPCQLLSTPLHRPVFHRRDPTRKKRKEKEKKNATPRAPYPLAGKLPEPSHGHNDRRAKVSAANLFSFLSSISSFVSFRFSFILPIPLPSPPLPSPRVKTQEKGEGGGGHFLTAALLRCAHLPVRPFLPHSYLNGLVSDGSIFTERISAWTMDAYSSDFKEWWRQRCMNCGGEPVFRADLYRCQGKAEKEKGSSLWSAFTG